MNKAWDDGGMMGMMGMMVCNQSRVFFPFGGLVVW